MKGFAEAYKLDLSLHTEGCRDIFRLDGKLNPADFQTYLDWTVRKGYCPPDITIERSLDERFVERASGRALTEEAQRAERLT